MSVVIGTLCLNEMEWLPKLYEQHKNWPGLVRWVFVEAADRQYANANPEMVSEFGLSVDGTSEFLRQLERDDERVVYYPYGFVEHENPALGKCKARQVYIDDVKGLHPNFLVALDADEFFMLEDQKHVEELLKIRKHTTGLILPYRNIWRPSILSDDPLFSWEIIGEFWQIRVCKIWRWYNGMSYSNNHNSPSLKGKLLNQRLAIDRSFGFIHMGFASSRETRVAKNRYYVERGEGKTDHRIGYVRSRAIFETWKPGDTGLPNNDKIIPYTGPIPEVFLG